MNKKELSLKKKECKSLSTKVDLNLNTVDSLRRLSKALSELDNDSKVSTDNVGLPMGSWRDLSDSLQSAYTMMSSGAELVKATSTKYTLLGKINVADGSKLAEELRKGCELISTATLIIHQPLIRCARPTRHYAKQYSRAVVSTIISLVESFATLKALEANIGAQKTGAVWSACDAVLTKLPKGNRACMRRELFTWVSDCNETMQEFQEMVDRGSTEVKSEAVVGEEDLEKKKIIEDGAWDEFCESMGTGDQYSAIEMPISVSCLALIKCSRGVFGLVLKACECAGELSSLVERKLKEENYNGDEEDQKTALERRRDSIWQWISNIHEMTLLAGEGVTEVGLLMYSPIDLNCGEVDAKKTWDQTLIGKQALRQRHCLLTVVNCVLDSIPPGGDQKGMEMSDEVMEMASKLQSAIEVRLSEIESGISNALKI